MRHLAYFVLASVIGLAVPSGTAHANFIINGDFSAGNTGFTSGHTFIPAPGTSATPGTYAVRTNPQL